MNDMSAPRAPWLRNCWYVAAWGDELVPGKLLGQTMLDQPVVLFRDGDGAAKAIGGRCPHRFAALADGTLSEAGEVTCPYHGLRFGSDGRCVHNPHQGGAVPNIGVPSWPVAEKHKLVWAWFGDPSRADPASIPDFSFLDDPHWEVIHGRIVGEGNYELYSDNILDLSHAQFIHPALAAPAFIDGERSARQEGDQVWYHVHKPDDYLSIVLGAAFDVEGRKQDFWTDVRWDAPAAMYLVAQSAEPGAGRETAKSTPSMHFLTPESTTRCHYFWAVARETRLGDTEFTAAMHAGFVHAFEHEDKPVIARQQEMMGGKSFWALDPVILKGDASAVLARRILDRLIRAEMMEEDA